MSNNRPTGRALRPPTATPFREIAGLTREMMALQQAAKDATAPARRNQENRGRALLVNFDPKAAGSPPVPTVTALTVPHGLGRKPLAVVARRKPAAIEYTMDTFTTRLVSFSSFAGSGTVEFWVY